MICKVCKTDKKDTDFIKNDTCYKCVYAQKLKDIEKMQKVCKVCKSPLKDKNRWKLCSKECADQCSAQQRRNYWIRKMPGDRQRHYLKF